MTIDPIVNQVHAQVLARDPADAVKRDRPGVVRETGKPDVVAVALPGSDSLQAEAAQPATAKQGEKELEKAVDRLREFATHTRREMEISVDRESGQFVVKVLDSKTKEVVRQIPSEDLLRVARQLDSNDKGGLLEATA